MTIAKIVGKVIGAILAVMVFVILLPIIILVAPVYIIIVGIGVLVASAKKQLPDTETKGRIMLDRARHFRLTPYSFTRAEKEFEKTAQEFADWLAKQPYSAESFGIRLWFFLVDEDHDLTPDRVRRILVEYLGGGWKRFRKRRLERAYSQYVGALKEFDQNFGGAK
jgi:hypothetical protein